MKQRLPLTLVELEKAIEYWSGYYAMVGGSISDDLDAVGFDQVIHEMAHVVTAPVHLANSGEISGFFAALSRKLGNRIEAATWVIERKVILYFERRWPMERMIQEIKESTWYMTKSEIRPLVRRWNRQSWATKGAGLIINALNLAARCDVTAERFWNDPAKAERMFRPEVYLSDDVWLCP